MRAQKIVNELGGATKLASQLKSKRRRGKCLTKQAVSMWKRVPVEHVLDIARLSQEAGLNYTPQTLRPDIFGRAA